MRENRRGAVVILEPQQQGFSLVEMMVALVLGLLVLTAIIQVFLSTQQSGRVQQSASRMQEDGRIAINLLTRYIRLAGYVTNPWDKGDKTWNPTQGERGFPAASPNFAQGQVVTGGTGNINGVDSIRIRYQGAADGSVTTCLGRAVPANELADITLSLSANDPDDGRSLQCTDNNQNTTQPLVAGLQDMQIWYGLSQDQGPVSGVDAVGRLTGATTYVSASQVPTGQWTRVISVQISLLARSDDNLTTQPQSYVFPITSATTTTPGDRRIRYVMGATSNIRNQAP